MTIENLKNLIEDLPDDMDIVIGWAFHDVLNAEVKTIKMNGKPITAFQLVDDLDDL